MSQQVTGGRALVREEGRRGLAELGAASRRPEAWAPAVQVEGGPVGRGTPRGVSARDGFGKICWVHVGQSRGF